MNENTNPLLVFGKRFGKYTTFAVAFILGWLCVAFVAVLPLHVGMYVEYGLMPWELEPGNKYPTGLQWYLATLIWVISIGSATIAASEIYWGCKHGE